MGVKPPYEDETVTHGICEECYKKVREGGSPGCEYLATCPYFNDSTYGMPEMFKKQYCKEDYHRCGRYLSYKAVERAKERR
ncbi:hypothetical protein ES703_77292 [subsurface metagenome]